MSGSTQFGTHPDAESLNAFAERALAGREREQVAAHLSVCGRCREVVFLAQEANAELEPRLVAAAAAPQTEGRSPWFRNWRLAWIPAAAVAAGISVAYIVHVRHEEPAGQMARVEKQGTPVVAITQPVPAMQAGPVTQSAPVSAESGKKATAEKRSSSPVAKGHEPVEMAEAPPLRPVVNAPVRSLAGAERESKPARPVATLAAAQAGVLSQSAGAPAEPARETATATGASGPGGPGQAASGPGVSEFRATPLTKSAANRVRSPGGSLAALMFKQAGLPSGLAAVSSANVQGNMLAVDSEGSVFLSTDGGLHWQSIGRQWSGKAIAVRSSAESKVSAKDEGQAGRPGFELVNDRGQVWVSADGRSWKSK